MKIVQEASRQAIENCTDSDNKASPIKLNVNKNGILISFNEGEIIKSSKNYDEIKHHFINLPSAVMIQATTNKKIQLKTSYTFHLENISFCGHPFRSERYFSFIVRKHKDSSEYACIVTISKNSTKEISGEISNIFKSMHDEMVDRLSVADEEYFLDE